MCILERKTCNIDAVGMDDGTGLIVDLDKGITHVLNEGAWLVWTMLEQPISVSELEKRYFSCFELDPDEGVEVLRDLSSLLDQMQQLGLIIYSESE